jgi:hypothetical protein
VVCLLVVYGRSLGRGLIADDFGWIYYSRIRSAADAWRLLIEGAPGFYRPLVALSFGANERWFGLAPMPYALTNLAMALAIMGGIAWLVRSLGFSVVAGVFAAGIWALNFHGISMALLWVSGRTSLMTTLFAVLAAIAIVKRRMLLAGLGTLAALLSKEEPLMLPAIFAVWVWLDARAANHSVGRSVRAAAGTAWPSFVALAIYAILRSRTTAFTPATAPSFYQLSAAPQIVVPNALQYLDRSLTFTAGVLLLGVIVFARRWPRLDAAERQTVAKGCVWLVLGFGVTIMVPVRSSLYVVFPTVGSALVGVAVGRAVWRAIPVERRRAAVVAVCALPLILTPIHWLRHGATRDQGLLSSHVVSVIRAADAASPAKRIVIHEDQAGPLSIESIFGGSLPQAMELITGRPVPVEIVGPASPDRTALVREDGTLHFMLIDGDFTLVAH